MTDSARLDPATLDPDRRALFEQLAAIQHAIWAHWMRHMLDDVATITSAGIAVIDAEHVARWQRQAGTAYQDLTDAEQAEDRAQVARYWPLLDRAGGPADG